jgi:hypothetical protein
MNKYKDRWETIKIQSESEVEINSDEQQSAQVATGHA